MATAEKRNDGASGSTPPPPRPETDAAAVVHPYQDPALALDQRVADLMSRMDRADKVGLLFQTMTVYGDHSASDPTFGLPSLRSMVHKRRMSHFNIVGTAGDGREFAEWHNAAQRIALERPLGIPITFSTDPRHHFTSNPGTGMLAGPFSQWPETLGLAALRSADRVRGFADAARQEYLAVGLRLALHPQIDLATEPRWSRISGTFGEDADLTSMMVRAYVGGFQGAAIGPDSVATMVKHFPGGGPQQDGEDPHFAYGREQVYPGGMFEHHLIPFAAAIEAGASQMMPYYGMPVGTEYEEVGFGFNRSVITGLLRERFGFDGIVCTDWGLLTDTQVMGAAMPARAWGVEHLSREERVLKALEAGVDQFGGELCTEVLAGLVDAGRIGEDRLDVSVRRLLREKFALGLFDQPFVDPDRAGITVGRDDFVVAGLQAQSDSMVLLTNGPADAPTLPLPPAISVYAEGIDAAAWGDGVTVVGDPADADVAVVRLRAPFEARGPGFESFFHAGSLAWPEEELHRILAIARSVPTVIDVYLDRPAIVTELADAAAALLVNFGTSDAALLPVLFGDREPLGRLPFDLPRSMTAVQESREDVPFDTADPPFRFGDGLSYRTRTQAVSG